MSRVLVMLGVGGLAMMAILCCGPAQAQLQIGSAYWQQDIKPDYKWSETAAGLEHFAERVRAAGTIHIFVTNQSSRPVAPQVTSVKPAGGEELLDTLELVWWRCLPAELAPGQMGQVSVRLRSPQEEDLVVTVTAEGSPPQTVPISVAPLPLRLQTVAWSQQGRKVFLVAQATVPDPPAIRRVWLDGEDVTSRCHLLAPDFFAGVSPIVLRPTSPLQRSSIHTYLLEDAQGRQVGWTLRTVDDDGFVPLGIYAMTHRSAPASTTNHMIETLIQLGFNADASFSTKDRNLLDRLATSGIRAFFYTSMPEPEVRGHPALYCYVLKDEPDVHDYYDAKDIPVDERIGHNAPDMIRRYVECRQADPLTPAGLVLDLTFVPANYYVYGQIADLLLPDCYPLTHGWQLNKVFESTQYSWWATGPRPVQFIMQVNYEDRPGEMKFRRPPFAEEIYLQYLYSLAGGARGFWGFMWPGEGARPGTIFHGPDEYPDVQAALSHAHAALGPLLPLINQSHPISLATTDDPQVKLTTLLGGQQALLIAVINKTVESLPEDFRYQTLRNLKVRIPSPPWLQPNFVGQVEAGKITTLPLQREEDGVAVVLPELKAGALLLVGADVGLPVRLESEYRRELAQRGSTDD